MPKDEFTTRRLHRCSFCYKTQDQVRRLVAGPDVYICDECIKLCYDIIADDVTPMSTAAPDSPSLPLPSEMKAVLDEYVIGQDEAKRTLCVAVYNHYKRINAPQKAGRCGTAKIQHPHGWPNRLRQDLSGPVAGAHSERALCHCRRHGADRSRLCGRGC